MCGILLGGSFEPRVRWLVRTKHFPESKNTSQHPKHFPESKSTSQNPKTHPRIQNTSQIIQNTSQNSKTLSRIEILGSVFGFWEMFFPYEPPYQGPVSRKSRKTFGPEKLFRVCNQDKGSNNFENDIINIS